jgi:GT2 family glycosyltransferase
MNDRFVLVSFCNNPESTTSPILCIKIPKTDIGAVEYAPVHLGYPGLINHVTGITISHKMVLIAFNAEGRFYIAGLQKRDLAPIFYQNLPEAKDIHSIFAWNNRLYVVSTGTDEVLAYDILHNKLDNYQVIWRASLEKSDTHHVNSIVECNGDLFVSAFGPKSGKLWSSALYGYIHNITRDIRIKDDIYHPHSLSAQNDQLYYCESHNGTLCSLYNQILQLSGYSRGVGWISDEEVCITTSIGRKVSRSTGQIGNPADPGDPAGKCGLTIQNIKSGKTLASIDFSWFGPEVYDVLVLSEEINLLKIATTAQKEERRILQSLLSDNALMRQNVNEQNEQMQALTSQVQALTLQVQALVAQAADYSQVISSIYASRSWRITKPLRTLGDIGRVSRSFIQGLALRMYLALPISSRQKTLWKDFIFGHFGFVFRGLLGYQIWLNAQKQETHQVIQQSLPEATLQDFRHKEDPDENFESRKVIKSSNSTTERKPIDLDGAWSFSGFEKIKSQPTTDITDIIISVGPDPKYIEKCFQSIKKYTDPGLYKLHLVVHQRDIEKLSIEITANAHIVDHSMEIFNFARANNLVLVECKGDAVLLNDDTEVTPRWLENLRQDSKGYMLTGAHTGKQCSGNPDMWGDGPAKFTDYPINMFCTFIPRRVREIIGLLDEEFIYYGGEDVDYSSRALRAGIPLIISSAYIHHKGDRSFGDLKLPLMQESDKMLFERYGIKAPFRLSHITPLVSVIMATHNRANLLRDAAQSILGGLYKNIELIIVDDNSSDYTWNVINDLQQQDSRVLGVKLPNKNGPVRARQRGIDISKGEFIAFFDDDDIAKPNRIYSPLNFLIIHSRLDAVYCDFEVVTDFGRQSGRVRPFNIQDYLNGKFDIGLGMLLIRKSVLSKVPLSPYYDLATDFDWVFRFTRSGFRIDYCPEVVLEYNRRGAPTEHLSGNTESIAQHAVIVQRENLLHQFKRKQTFQIDE